jgi:hypothetical protein
MCASALLTILICCPYTLLLVLPAAGSAYCIPCPMGTYSDATATKECTEW